MYRFHSIQCHAGIDSYFQYSDLYRPVLESFYFFSFLFFFLQGTLCLCLENTVTYFISVVRTLFPLISHFDVQFPDMRSFYKVLGKPSETDSIKSQISSRNLVGKGTAQKDTIKDISSDSQVNSNFPYRWSPASLTLSIYFYLFSYLYI